MPWTTNDIPDQRGKTMLITGANSGIGYEAALALAGAGARVLLACRDQRKGKEAVAQIAAAHPDATVELRELDLASLDSVRRFAAEIKASEARLDGLINNAGVMAIPYRQTADGFEMQFGTNHLGHFALTGLLLDLVLAAPAGRVVTVSSNAHKILAAMRWDDLQWQHGYAKWRAYAQSKLANVLFTYELQRRLEAKHASAISVACHPGYAATNLQAVGPRMAGSSLMESFMDLGNRLFSQSAAMGALPTLYAATAADVRGGDYIGPDGPFENWGHPTKRPTSARSRDRASQTRLWEVSEKLTGISYPA